MDTKIVPLQFEGFNVRATPDMKLAVIDVLRAIGQVDPYGAWRNSKALHPEFMEESSRYSFGGRGRPADVLSEAGVLKLLMVSRGPRAAAFRNWAASTLKRVASADIGLPMWPPQWTVILL